MNQCPNCSANIDNNFKFCPSCGYEILNEMICPKCNFKNEPNSNFCQECGASLLKKDKRSNKLDKNPELAPTQIEPVPTSGITIEFSYSTSASFEFALNEAKKLPSFKMIGDGKNAIYRVSIDKNETASLINLLEQLKGWRKRTVYIDGEKVTWDSVFSFYYCYAHKLSSYKPDMYCFGFENEWSFNLWGCIQSQMNFTDNSEWFSYGKWLNNKGDWEFDKKRIKYELEKNLYDFRFCPAINFNLIQDIIDSLPNLINPNKNRNWKFMESYNDDTSNCIPIRINRFGYDETVYMKGVCPIGKGYIQEIKNNMKLKLPDSVK